MLRVSIDLVKGRIRLRALDTPHFNTDRNRLMSFDEKEAAYDGDDFLGWDLPVTKLGEIMERWPDQVEVKDKARTLVRQYIVHTTPVAEAERVEIKVARADGQGLLPYQEDYIRITPDKPKLLCAWDTGTGKCTGSLLRAAQLGFTRMVIVGPLVTKRNWASEVRKNLGGTTLSYHGTIKQRKKLQEEIKDASIIFVNYEMTGELVKVLAAQKLKPDSIIIDEAHLVSRRGKIRNKAAKALIQLNKNAPVQLLSGTPILKDVEDLYELIAMIAPMIAGSKSKWDADFVHVIHAEEKSKIVGGRKITWMQPIITQPINVDKCHEKIQPVLVKVDRRDFTDFEDLTSIVTCEMTKDQQKLYGEFSSKLRIELATGKVTTQNVLTRMLRLSQIVEGCFNIEDSDSVSSGKVEYIKHILDNENEKVIIWSRFKPITYILHDLYKDKGLVLFNGDVPEELKNLAVWSFQGVDGPEEQKAFDALAEKHNWHLKPGEATVFAGTLDFRASIGINLHRYCSKQIFPSFHLNHGVNLQAAARLLRYGQAAKAVQTDFLVMDDTIEPEILEKVINRYRRNAQIIDGKFSRQVSQAEEMLGMLKRMGA